MSAPRPLPDATLTAGPAARGSRDEHHCITCADEGVPMRVVGPEAGGLAPCAGPGGGRRLVETALVGPVAPGDALLVHAGVALARLESPIEESPMKGDWRG